MIAHPPRLACVKHAASVRPEPGSNSPRVLIRLIRTGLPLSWLLVRITFFVRQLNSPRNLIVHSGSTSPPRTSIHAQSSFQTAFQSIPARNHSNYARFWQPTILHRRERIVKWLQATARLSPLQLNSRRGADFCALRGTPILATSPTIARGQNTEFRMQNHEF